MSNELINYRQTIFTKIKNFFKKTILNRENKKTVENNKIKKNFLKDIVVVEDKEEKRLKELKKLYDNKEIEEEMLSNEDIDKLIEMYDRETEELRNDTERRKKNIAHIIATKK